MPVLQARTREQIRTSVGYNVGGIYVSSISGHGSGTNTTDFDDDTLRGGANSHNGKYWLGTSGSNDGVLTRVSDYAIANNRVTVAPGVTAFFAVNDTYELWSEAYPPPNIHDFINQAIIDATGRAFDPSEDLSLHGDGTQARFDIPAVIDMLSVVFYRSSVRAASVHDCERLFDETTDTDFCTQSNDTEVKKSGNSLKLVIGSGVSAGDVITDSFTAIDLSRYTHLEGWIRCSTTLAAADFRIHLDDGVVQANGTDRETLDVPAVAAADTWTYFRIALANTENDGAIASIGIEFNANQAAKTVWFDQMQAVNHDEAIWTKVAPHLWGIDKEARDLVLTPTGRSVVGYAPIKLVGGDAPALLTSDAGVTEISDQYVIARATELSLASASGGPSTDPDGRRQLMTYWSARAERERANMPMLVNARLVT